MTSLLLAYDTESEACLESVKKIVKVHEKNEYPGTFFIVASLLDKQGDEYKAIFNDHPLFEIASHSMTHLLLREHRWCGDAGPEEQFHAELVGSKEKLEDHFQRRINGFRSPCGWPQGFAGAQHLLSLVREAGYSYISTVGWGADTTLPAPIQKPFAYSEDGYGDILEIPMHGWHENVAKGNTSISFDKLKPEGPNPIPEIDLQKTLETPEDEIAMNRKLMEAGIRMKASYVTPIWHPWSLNKFDPEMRMVDGVMQTGIELGLETSTFSEFANKFVMVSH